MPKGRNRLRPTTMAGLLMAVAAALIVAGVVIFVAIGNRTGQKPPALPGEVIDIGAAPKSTGAVQDVTSGVPASGAARLQFADKRDPSRLQSELSFDKLDPVGNGYYTLDRPRAWVYMRDGRALYITAASGRVKMPGKAQQPESGEFTGGVTIRMYPPAPVDQPGRAVDAEGDSPAMLAFTPNLGFDVELLELSTDDPVMVSTPSMLFRGQGLLVRANEVKERLEFLKTSGEFVRYNPKLVQRRTSAEEGESPLALEVSSSVGASGKTAQSEPPVARGGSDAGRPDASTGSPLVPDAPTSGGSKETLYKAVAAGRVTVRQMSRELAADTLEIWSRVIDNQLPDDALAPLEFASLANGPGDVPKTTEPSGPTEAGASVDETAVPTGAGRTTEAHASTGAADGPKPLFVSAGEGDVVMSWQGPLVLAPVIPTPEEPLPEQLGAGNHFAARFSAEREGGEISVRMIDRESDSAALCTAVEYRATQRSLRLIAGSGRAVVLTSPSAGQVGASNITVDLGTGLGHVEGAGSLVALGNNGRSGEEDGSKPENGGSIEPFAATDRAGVARTTAAVESDHARQITWTDQADFQFRMIEGRLSASLDWAAFAGSVVAQDRTSAIGGDFLRAEFGPSPVVGSGGDRAMVLRKLKVQGSAAAMSGPQGANLRAVRTAGLSQDPFVLADSLEVAFAPTKEAPQDVEPVFAQAIGSGSASGDPADSGARPARVGNRDSVLSAPRIEARFGRDEQGQLTATDIVATGSGTGAGDAVFESRAGSSEQQTTARADRIRADGRARTAELTGERVQVSRSGSSTITGTKIRLDDRKETLIVDGAGMFEHVQLEAASEVVPVDTRTSDGGTAGTPPENTAQAPATATKVTTTWSKGMVFDNRQGEIVCEGQCVVTGAAPLSSQILKSDKVLIRLTPEAAHDEASARAPTSGPGGAAPIGGSLASGGRRLVRAEAIGSIVDRDDGQNATVEVRRYGRSARPASAEDGAARPEAWAPAPGRVLEQVMYIEGPRINHDETTGVMTVPAAGRAIIRDQRGASAEPKPESASAGVLPIAPGANPGSASTTPISSRGTSGFTWSGSMDFDRYSGVLTMRKDVELVHITMDGQQRTRLVASELAATFAANETSRNASQRTDLIKAEANGAVYAESGPMKLVADRFSYDAQSGTAEAMAAPGNRVTLYDDRKPTPLVAKKLFWDLVKDRVVVSEPAPMVAPK